MNMIWTSVLLAATALVATVTAGPLDGDIPTECPRIDSRHETIHLAHETNCEKFYQCDHGRKVLKDCAMMNADRRLHFNPRKQVCDWPEFAGCELNTKVVRSPYPNDCTRYYEIRNGEKNVMKCSGGQHFSPTAEICMSPATAGCEVVRGPCVGLPDGHLIADSTDCGKYFLCQNDRALPKKCAGRLHFGSSSRGCVDPSEALCDYTVVESYPNDCTKYYEIHNGKSITKTCPGGQHFSPAMKRCMSPDTAGCEVMNGPCAGMPDGTLLEYCDCDKYLSCHKGKDHLEDCRSGLHFSKKLKTCTEPSIALCDYTVLEPYESDCTKYYSVHNGVKSMEHCPAGKHFSPKNRVCMPPNLAGCAARSCTGGVSSGSKIRHHCQCGKYYLCDDGEMIGESCPRGLHFSESLQDCVEPNIAGCP